MREKYIFGTVKIVSSLAAENLLSEHKLVYLLIFNKTAKYIQTLPDMKLCTDGSRVSFVYYNVHINKT